MNFDRPKLERTQDGSDVDLDTGDKEQLQEMESSIRSMVHQLLERAAEEPDKKRFVIEQITTYGKVLFKGKEQLLDMILKKIGTVHYENDTEFGRKVAEESTKTIVEFSASSDLSLKELAEYFRVKRIEQNGDIPLDRRGVLYTSRYKDIIELHINKGLTGDTWKEALSKLVTILQADTSIQVLKMRSPVVAEDLERFRRLGFAAHLITDEKELAIIRSHFSEGVKNREGNVGEATIGRDEFLNSEVIKRIIRV